MGKKRKILAVDDELDLLLIIKTALSSEGFEVMTATNGPDALAMAEDEKPDLIILDVMMPEMNGFEVLQALRESVTTERIPVIMLTGVSEREKIRDALSAGIDYYIVKPFQLHDLVAKVNLAIADAENPGL
ncbi:MAG: response regulator [Candidatus Sumerlaeaceae bacterium]|jgi:DNA-binding response OmpR family regulator